MAETNQISRKRMRFSSTSATELLTTRKSQNQRNRSGQIATVVSQIGNGSQIHHFPSLNGKIDSKINRTYPRVTIKDLRLRRVFSPSSISTNCELNSKDDESPCEFRNSNIVKDGIKANVDGLGDLETEEFLQTTPPDSEMLSSVHIREEINEPVVKKSDTNLSSKSVLHPCSRAKIYRNPGSFSYKRLLPYLMQASDGGTSSSRCSIPEKSLSKNPLNVNLCCDKELGESAEDPKKEVSELMTAKCQLPETIKPVSQSVDRFFSQHSAGSVCGNSSPLKKVIASSPIKKSACSRRKLFKTPGSVNYRRMLPYLRDIQEDNHGLPETVSHQKNTEENTPSSILVSENERTDEMVTSNVARESDTCSNGNKESLPCEQQVSVSPERSDPDKDQETQVKHVIPDTEKNLGTPRNVLDSEVPLSSPPHGFSEVASSALRYTFAASLAGEENMNGPEKTDVNITAEQPEKNSSDLAAELLDPSAVLATPASISPSKGILKRSIRGCRGICSCLNCSSFRLNAERAFEFSRNQLQDTEVMVLDLVGEISRLRDMLEKYGSTDHNESNQSQAEEAAKRACEASELAKSRLHQMNDDLQVHCRIPNEQRARVKFAHYVQEKTMNITD